MTPAAGTPQSLNQQAMEQVLWQTVREHEREAARGMA